MASSSTSIAERPVPPKRRLSFPLLMLRMIGNPLASWAENFYAEPVVFYRWLGLETLFVMDPALIQRILLDDIDNYSRQPINDDVFGEAIGGGLLNAEGEDWRWQRRLAAPCSLMFRPSPPRQKWCSNAGARRAAVAISRSPRT